MPSPVSIVSPESFSSFGDLLKHLRLRAGLTQRELAIAIDYNFTYLSRLEHNQRVPEAAVVRALFVPALGLDHEPAWAARLVQLAQDARARPLAPPVGPRPAPAAGVTVDRPEFRQTLPLALTPLIGRQVTVEAIEAMLTSASVRLLTLLGPPGIGKTRLAQQVTLDLGDQFADGARFVDLTAARSADEVLQAITAALGLSEAQGETLEQRLTDWLGSRELLLVLDNFEHVVAVAPKLSRWLLAAPGLTLLATSREALRLAGEHQFAVPPLSVPVASLLLPPSEQRAPAVASYPSVELFVQRARAARPDFVLTVENVSQVAELCIRLDGLPLAIELAAARLRHFSLGAMLERLDRRLQWLTGGPRDGPTWRQTLRGAFDWSYDLLGPEEQRVFRHLAVFAGPFTVEAVEAVTAGTALSAPTLDLLLALADKSLVQSSVDATGDSRFSLLETLREYGAEKWAAGEADLAHRRQAAFYLALGQRAERELTGPQQQRWLQRLDLDRPNWLAALHWCAAQSADSGLRLAAALRGYWQVRGLFTEARLWLHELLAKASAPEARGAGLRAAAYFAAAIGDTDQADELAQASLQLALAAGTPPERADALSLAGRVATWQSDYDRGRSWLLEALALHRQLGDGVGAADDLHALGVTAKEQGDFAQAVAYHQESLALSRARGNNRGLVTELTQLGIAAYWQSDFSGAARLAEESLTLCRELNSPDATALALESLAMATHRLGEPARAREWLAEALVLYEETGNKGGEALILDDLGTVVRAQGEPAQAFQLHRKALALAVETGERRRAAFCLEGLGAALADTEPGLAAQLLAGAQALRQIIQSPLPPAEHASNAAVVASLRARLGPDALAANWAQGPALTLAQWKERLLTLSTP